MRFLHRVLQHSRYNSSHSTSFARIRPGVSVSANRIRCFSSWDDQEEDVTIQQSLRQQRQLQQQQRQQQQRNDFRRQEINRPEFDFSEERQKRNEPPWNRQNRPSLEPPRRREFARNFDGPPNTNQQDNYSQRERSNQQSSARPRRIKPWNDTQRSLGSRVEALTQASNIHPADISSPLVEGQRGSAMERLMEECCRQPTLETMTWAESIMERLLLEKEKINRQVAEQSNTAHSNNYSQRGRKPSTRYLVLPISLWDKLLFGWSDLTASPPKDQRPIPVPHILDRLFEGLQQSLRHASMDDAHDHELTQRYQEHPLHTSRPNRQFLNLYLRALAAALPQENDPYKLDDYLEKAYNHLEQMQQLAKHNAQWKTAPNIRSYMHVMQMIAHSRHPQAGSKAKELLNYVEDDIWEEAKQDALRAWQKRKEEEQAREQARLKEKMGGNLSGFRSSAVERSSQLEKDEANAATTVTSTTSVQSSANLEYSDYSSLPSKIKQELPTPDAAFYTTCLMAMANSASATKPKEVEHILDKAMKRDDVFIVDGPMLAMAIRAVGNILEHEENVMERVALAETAQRILGKVSGYWKKLQRDQKRKARHGKPPYSVTEDDRRQAYNACLSVWSKAACRESARQCEALLFTMMNQRKTARKIVAKAREEVEDDTSEDSEEEEDDEDDGLVWEEDSAKMPRLGDYVETRPNVVSFNIVLNAWLRCHSSLAGVAPGKVFELLKLQKAYGERAVNHDLLIGPDAQSYTLAILAQARRQKMQHALPKAKKLLKVWLDSTDPIQLRSQSQKRGGKTHNPESLVAPFSAVLKVIHETPPGAAFSKGKKKGDNSEDDEWNSTVSSPLPLNDEKESSSSAPLNPLYETALDIYHAVRMDTHQLGITPDHHFYAAFLACVNRHGGKGVEAQTMTQQVMEEACASGQVSRIVWPRLQTAANELGGWDVLWTDALDCSVEELKSMETTSQLPRYWRRNVPFAWK